MRSCQSPNRPDVLTNQSLTLSNLVLSMLVSWLHHKRVAQRLDYELVLYHCIEPAFTDQVFTRKNFQEACGTPNNLQLHAGLSHPGSAAAAAVSRVSGVRSSDQGTDSAIKKLV
jgi:hypothetical protein